MLGIIGKSAKSVLTRAGYELSRPTHFERTLMRNPFEDWLGSDMANFAAVYDANRKTLAEIPSWVSDASLERSLWRYGVPEMWATSRTELGQTGLNEIEKDVAYTDLIVFIARAMGVPIRYFEIGVSVGKNFLQVCRQLPGADIVGLDVEEPNAVLADAMGGAVMTWDSGIDQTVDTLAGGERAATIRLAHYTMGAGSAAPALYVRGDQFADATWDSLKGRRFNFIFSDGVHTADAVRRELDFLIDRDLLTTDGPFVMYWDDLVNIEMQTAFVHNARRLQAHFGGDSWYGLHWIHGTYGARRLNGLFSTFRPSA